MKSEVKVAQSCPTLCDPMDYIVHGILQARILEWVAYPSPGDLPNQGIKPGSPALKADSLTAQLPGKPGQSYEPLPNVSIRRVKDKNIQQEWNLKFPCYPHERCPLYKYLPSRIYVHL